MLWWAAALMGLGCVVSLFEQEWTSGIAAGAFVAGTVVLSYKDLQLQDWSMRSITAVSLMMIGAVVIFGLAFGYWS